MTEILYGTQEIDYKAVLGLLGTANSLAYKVHELEKHFHNSEDWYGLAAVPDGETHRADCLTLGTRASFQLDAGNDTWGAWLQILGSSDTPNRTGMVKFDLHKIQIVASEITSKSTFIQIGYGDTGAASLTSLAYTTIAYLTPTSRAAESAVSFMMPRIPAGSKVWARCMAIGANTMTINFYFGLHGYIG